MLLCNGAVISHNERDDTRIFAEIAQIGILFAFTIKILQFECRMYILNCKEKLIDKRNGTSLGY